MPTNQSLRSRASNISRSSWNSARGFVPLIRRLPTPMCLMRRQIVLLLIGTAVPAVVVATVPSQFSARLCAAYATVRGYGANVETNRTVLDLGEVEAGPVLTAQFDVGNTGGKRLLLTRQPSGSGCNCLTADDLVVIPPGERRPILLRLDTRDVEGPLRLKQLYQTNDTRFPVLKLEVLATVQRDGGPTECREPAPIKPIPMQLQSTSMAP